MAFSRERGCADDASAGARGERERAPGQRVTEFPASRGGHSVLEVIRFAGAIDRLTNRCSNPNRAQHSRLARITRAIQCNVEDSVRNGLGEARPHRAHASGPRVGDRAPGGWIDVVPTIESRAGDRGGGSRHASGRSPRRSRRCRARSMRAGATEIARSGNLQTAIAIANIITANTWHHHHPYHRHPMSPSARWSGVQDQTSLPVSICGRSAASETRMAFPRTGSKPGRRRHDGGVARHPDGRTARGAVVNGPERGRTPCLDETP